ncbi:MAG: hypothetical protein AAFR19_09120 [Pseudomonadota bacterium]
MGKWMKNVFLLPASLVVLVSCDVASTSEAESVSRSETPEAQSSPSPQVAEVDGLSFRVVPSDDRSMALVGIPSQRGSYTGSDVEAAAEQITGCAAIIVSGEWVFLGDLKNFELSNLRPNVRRPIAGWQVELSC